MLLPATPGWVSLPVVVGVPRHSWLRVPGAVPRHSWLGSAGGGGVWCAAVVCWWGCGWCVVWLVPRHSWRRFSCARRKTSLSVQDNPTLTHKRRKHEHTLLLWTCEEKGRWVHAQGSVATCVCRNPAHDVMHKCVCSNQRNKKGGCAVRAVVTVAPHCTAGQDR